MSNLIDELEREKSHSDHMAGMAQLWMRRAQDAERTLAIAVHAAGDKVVVYRDHLYHANDLELIRVERPEDMSVHLITRKAKPHLSPSIGDRS